MGVWVWGCVGVRTSVGCSDFSVAGVSSFDFPMARRHAAQVAHAFVRTLICAPLAVSFWLPLCVPCVRACVRVHERERQGETGRDRETERQRDRQAGRQTDRQAEKGEGPVQSENVQNSVVVLSTHSSCSRMLTHLCQTNSLLQRARLHCHRCGQR